MDIPQLGGHEQEGTRPAIIIAEVHASILVVIPCTSNLQALRFPFTTEIDASKRNGLLSSSVALVLQIRAIDKKRLKKRIGLLEKETLKNLDFMLKKMLGI